jgi:hypothetical protein
VCFFNEHFWLMCVHLLPVPLRLAEAVLACPGFEEYAAYLPELVSCEHCCFIVELCPWFSYCCGWQRPCWPWV